jgi:hypothetical protein
MAECWYKIAKPNEALSQGDLIYSCPVLAPPTDYDLKCKANGKISAECQRYNVVVMSQSCDVDPADPLEFITVCPFDILPVYFVNDSITHDRGSVETIRKGWNYNFYLLNKCRLVDKKSKEIVYETDYLLVDFRTTYSVPYAVLMRVSKKNTRVHLESPFRERLSQAYGWYFMRVALSTEDEIPEFSKDKKNTKGRYNVCDAGWQAVMKDIEESEESAELNDRI